MKGFLRLITALALYCTLLSYPLLSAGNYPALIKNIQVSHNIITIEPTKAFAEPFLREKTLTYEYDADIDLSSLDISIVTIPFLTNAAPAIWVTGKTFTVESMDKDLYESLHRIREALKLFYPQLAWNGDIVPQKIIENRQPESTKKEGIGLLFSGGVDSTGSALGNINIKQLLITNYGIDRNFVDDATWNSIKQQTNTFASTYGQSTAFIRFNYRRAFKEKAILKYCGKADISWFHHVAHGLYHLSTPAPLLFLKGYSVLYIGSSFTGDWPFPWGSHPLIDNNLCYAGIRINHDQTDLTRSDKIGIIARVTQERNLPTPPLRVCWNDKNAGNCQRCEKCLRTIHAVLSQGLDPAHFNLPISLAALKKRTEELFARTPFHLSVHWEWHNAQKASTRNLMSIRFRNMHSKELIAYLEWFSSLDLRTYLDLHEKHRPDERKRAYFSTLWEKGIQLRTTLLARG